MYNGIIHWKMCLYCKIANVYFDYVLSNSKVDAPKWNNMAVRILITNENEA